MRVLQIHTRYHMSGGEDRVVDAEAALLREAGHEVSRLDAFNPRGAKAALSLLAAPHNPLGARRARAAAAAFKPDVAHVHNTWFGLSPAVIPALDAMGIPVVMTLHNYRLICANAQLYRDGHPCTDCVGTHPWHGVQHACYRDSRLASTPAAATIALNRAKGTWVDHVTKFVALTDFARSMFIAGGLPAERIVVKPNFTADPGPRSCAPSESSTVLVVGRLSPEKGVETLIDGFNRLGDTDLELVVVGDGPERAKLESQAGPRVRFTGWLDPAAVQQLLLSARALCFPSEWYEPFGLAAVEAMAAGLPILTSPVGSLPDLIKDGAGWIAKQGTIAGWQQALISLRHNGRVDCAGGAARKRWKNEFSPGIGLSILRGTYKDAAVASERAST